MGWGHLKIFSGTTKPAKLKFTQKLSDIVKIQVYINQLVPGGQVRPQWGKPFYVCLYCKKIFKNLLL
jgi:hypothetical protein